MYTIPAMPKKVNTKGPWKVFQLKLYGDDVKRWGEIFWTAHKRGADRRLKITDQAVNEALLNLPGAQNWLVTKEERLYFYGKAKSKPDSLLDLTPEGLAELYSHPRGYIHPSQDASVDIGTGTDGSRYIVRGRIPVLSDRSLDDVLLAEDKQPDEAESLTTPARLKA